jgi:hypothetical protein
LAELIRQRPPADIRWRETSSGEGRQVIFTNMQPQIRRSSKLSRPFGLSIFKDVAEFDKYIAARQRRHEEGE